MALPLPINYAGSSNISNTGYPLIYPNLWDPLTKTVRSNDPASPYPFLTGVKKTPTVEKGLQGAMTKTPGDGGTGAGDNPLTTLSNVKSPTTKELIDKMVADFGSLRSTGAEDIGAFRGEWEGAAPEIKGYLGEESGVVNDYYGGGVERALANLREQRKGAVTGATDRAMGDLRRLLSLETIGAGGGSAPGTSKYIGKLGLDKAAELQVRAGLDDSEQARRDYEYLQAAKLGLRGTRGQAMDQYLQRQLVPGQVEADWFNRMVSSGLMPLEQADLANTFYGVRNPAGYIGDTYGGVQGATLQDVISQRQYDLGLKTADANVRLAQQQAMQKQGENLFNQQFAQQQAAQKAEQDQRNYDLSSSLLEFQMKRAGL